MTARRLLFISVVVDFVFLGVILAGALFTSTASGGTVMLDFNIVGEMWTEIVVVGGLIMILPYALYILDPYQ